MTSTEDKLARELGFLLDLDGYPFSEPAIHKLNRSDPTRYDYPFVAGALWRKCLELTEQIERLQEENAELQEELDGWKGML